VYWFVPLELLAVLGGPETPFPVTGPGVTVAS
jgi:hypothetical protein